MNSYKKMKERHQKEINALPLYFAFSDKQFYEALKKMGLTEKDTDKLYKFGNAGCIIKREDSQLINETFDRQEREIEAAIAADKTGLGFIYDMFRYELANHEYGYTRCIDDTFNALGLDVDDVMSKPNMKKGFLKAEKDIIAYENSCD